MSDARASAWAAEITTTVVIGSGLSGLAVASELNRNGVESIVVAGMVCGDTGAHLLSPDPAALVERHQLMRVLRNYAENHRLDIRIHTYADTIRLLGNGSEPGLRRSRTRKWAVHTAHGILLADSIVLTNFPQNRLHKFLQSLGLTDHGNIRQKLRALGVYLVGVGGLVSTREIALQAKTASAAIVTRQAGPPGITA